MPAAPRRRASRFMTATPRPPPRQRGATRSRRPGRSPAAAAAPRSRCPKRQTLPPAARSARSRVAARRNVQNASLPHGARVSGACVPRRRVRPAARRRRARRRCRPRAGRHLPRHVPSRLRHARRRAALHRRTRDATDEIRHAAHRGGGGVRRGCGRAGVHGHTGRPARRTTRRASRMRIALLRKHYCARILHTDTHTSFEEHTHGDSIEVGSEA